MQIGALTSYIDVAQLALYAFWLFFAGLVYYLLRENKREGYPLVAPDRGFSRVVVQGFPPAPPQKSFLMHDGSVVLVPRDEKRERLTTAVYAGKFPGAPLIPTGEAMLAGIGPGAYAQRADVPDLTYDDHLPKIVPLRAAPAFFLAWEDPNLLGFTVIAADEAEAGTVADVWIDRSEVVARYLEVQLTLTASSHRVLLPMNYVRIDKKHRRIICNYVSAAQFALVPVTKHPEQVTLLEEDKITAFYSGGMLFATPRRAEPLL